jgi:lipid-A-disaccharide synthase
LREEEPRLRVLISTGEVSGDIAAARIARTIRDRVPDVELYGIGGAHMADAGVELVASTEHLGAVGVTEAAAVAPRLFGCWRRLRARALADRPDVALLIGNDVFHVLMARRLRALGIPTAAYFPPQAWIWRSVSRAIARSFDLILAAFPEEEHVYGRAGANVLFVGHYLSEILAPVTSADRAAARRALGLEARAVVGLLPGSRGHEIAYVGPVLLATAVQFARVTPDIQFVLPVANEMLRPGLEQLLRQHQLSAVVRLTHSGVAAMRASDLLLVCSGTATLEATLLGIPMVIVYRVSTLTYLVALAAIRLGLLPAYRVGAPNVILERTAIPELLQRDLTPDALASEAAAILASPERQREQRMALRSASLRLTGDRTLARIVDALIGLGSSPGGLKACVVPREA